MTTNNTATKQPNVLRVATITGCVLFIPLIMMQISDEWDWGIGDFIIIGVLLFSTGLVYEYFVENIRHAQLRVVAALALLAALFLIWGELAVGLIEQILTGDVWAHLFN